MNKYLLMTSLFAFRTLSIHAASQATFSVIATTATNITVPENRHAYVQYRVTNNTASPQTLTMVPIPNVTQRTGEQGQCGNPFTLAHNQSCNLTLYVDGALQHTSYEGGPVICKTQLNTNIPNRFLCSQSSKADVLSISTSAPLSPSAHKLYVSNWLGNSISLCYINSSGSFEHCLVSATSGTFLNPEALAISGSYLYIANIGGGISSCVIDQLTGELSNCINAIDDINTPIYSPDGIAMVGSTAYISNAGPLISQQGVTTCTISGSSLTSCTFTRGDAEFSVPSDIASFSNTIYITNYNSQTLQTTFCTISPSLCTSGSGEGIVSGTNGLLNEPEGLRFATLNSINYSYFTNYGNNTVTFCQVDAPTSFSNCINTTDGHFEGFGNLAILNSLLKAYIPSGQKSIDICDVISDTGDLSNCTTSNQTSFDSPSGLVIQ